jgi:anti-anti-sigma factor
MDSTGLRALLSLRGRCAAGGVELVLRRGPRVVQRLFALTGSERAFTFEP